MNAEYKRLESEAREVERQIEEQIVSRDAVGRFSHEFGVSVKQINQRPRGNLADLAIERRQCAVGKCVSISGKRRLGTTD